MCRRTVGVALILPVLSGAFWGPWAAAQATVSESANAALAPISSEVLGGASDAEALKERWGVEVLAVRRAAAGRMLDFRYRVVDATKAAPLFVRQTKPYLIHQRTGKALGVPETAKLGPLRNSNMPQAGRVYWMFFGNPGGFVRAGDKVTVAIGNFRVADLLVQ